MTEPKIRFMQYKKPWNLTSVGEITMELNEYNNLSSNIPLMTSSRSGLMLQSEFRDKASTDNKGTLFSVVPYGKCTYRHMSDDDIFHFNINDLAEAGLVSKEYPVFDTTKGNSLFLLVEYLNNSARFRAFCKAQKKGGTRTRLYYKNLCEYKFYFPSVNEQTDMEMFLKSVNKIISLLSEEIRLWEEKKKGVMQKIFSQEVRFKDENGEDYPEWEDATLEELLDFEQPTKYIVKSTQYDPSYSIPVLTAGQSLLLGYTDEIDGIYPADASNPVIIFDDFTTSYHWIDYPFKVKSSAMKILTPVSNKDMLFEYVYYAMGMIDYKPTSHSRQWISTFSKFTIHLPCIEEQKRIIECLSSIDEVIILKKQKLEAWQNIKKGLLQQMFV